MHNSSSPPPQHRTKIVHCEGFVSAGIESLTTFSGTLPLPKALQKQNLKATKNKPRLYCMGQTIVNRYQHDRYVVKFNDVDGKAQYNYLSKQQVSNLAEVLIHFFPHVARNATHKQRQKLAKRNAMLRRRRWEQEYEMLQTNKYHICAALIIGFALCGLVAAMIASI